MKYKNLLLEMTSGRIFSTEFVKKDGSRRIMTARANVKKGNKGIGMSYDPIKRGLLPVLDITLSRTVEDINKAKRSINLNSIIWVKVKGKKYFINDIIIDESIESINNINKTLAK